MAKITRALISVSDKNGIIEFSQQLAGYGVELLSTGGTARLLRDAGLNVKDVSEFTGFPEMLDGRVKTLHPKVHGGLLGMRSNPEHVAKMKEHGIENIDMVVVNLYPFEATTAREGCHLEDAIENIDIGGPTMLRSAAKNYPDVTVLVDSSDYPQVLEEMKASDGAVSVATNFALAVKVFQHTAAYDGAISNYLGSRLIPGEVQEYPPTFSLQVKKAQDLRYGENPHQSAAFYIEKQILEPCVANAVQLQGKELSFNNIIDLDAAIETVKEFEQSAAVIIKHTNPCGAALADSPLTAYLKARECDPVSAFGGIVGFNRTVDAETAKELTSTFLEAVIAPGYSEEALAIFTAKKNVRVMQVPLLDRYVAGGFDLKRVTGGVLLQGRDLGMVNARNCRVVTERTPTVSEYEALDFAWRVCKHVKSNAIVFSNRDQTVGIGAGQMSRVDSSKIAVQKALLPTRGTVLASDAFFPFRDGVDAAAEAGVTAIIQTGGSVRDEEVIKAANEHGIAMLFTAMRHFRH
ncbi:MAG TPA: bifunctional phosphoribosylaminoimidazolecarboxamide formyltransferase/IMP cyclohydrolase [Desulfuromonadales bacterium]|nr:bifunctional phosphoribosylaminoimidazolecarboxamide formyltransferase/IMP cyclohydrolase [Desulfuromonadales bacterium]